MKLHRRTSITAMLIAGWLTATVASTSATAGPPVPVTIVLEDLFTSETSAVGGFTATGALNTVGADTFDFWCVASTVHCFGVLEDAFGTITIIMQCKSVMTSEYIGEGPGHWTILRGSGAYANLHGTGTLAMGFNLATGQILETLVGSVFFDERK